MHHMAMDLIGRESELRALESRFSNPRDKAVAIYGRRRVGKTAIIEEFCKDKRSIILTAVEGS